MWKWEEVKDWGGGRGRGGEAGNWLFEMMSLSSSSFSFQVGAKLGEEGRKQRKCQERWWAWMRAEETEIEINRLADYPHDK